MSQKVLQYVEIDVDYCSLTYSVAPCQASLTNSPPTGTIKCFNTLVTCQDRDNFTNVPVTLRFAVPTSYLPDDISCIPSIKSIDFDPAVISLGENLGQRATLTVSFDDHRHSDTGDGFDKYVSDSPSVRPYNPYTQGTFWGKFRSRQPFLRGRSLRWITGFLGDALEDMETRHYIIDSFSGPDNNGKFTIVAKDLLKLADGDRALAPMTSNGFLNANITNSQTSLVLSPSGVGNEYPPTGYVAIGGSDVVSYSHSGGGTVTTTDDPFTKLLLHFDHPVDGSTAIVDSSPVGRALNTIGGNAQQDIAQKKFGMSSCLFDGTGDCVTFADSADWAYGSGDFTIDMWIMPHATTATFQALYLQTADANNMLRLALDSSGRFECLHVVAAVTQVQLLSAAITLDVWTHVAVVRASNVWTLYVNGVAVATTTNATAVGDNASVLFIGTSSDAASWPYNGWIDEYRISKGVARWTADFTPPTEAYESGNTGSASDTLTIVRAQANTTGVAHTAQDRVQLALSYTAQSPDVIISDLLQTYAGVGAEFIPSADWATETSTYLNRLYTAIIAQPTSVNTLISELIEQAGLSVWWDDRQQQIGLLVLRGLVYSTYLFSEDVVVADSFESEEQPDLRLSQIHTYFGQINPLTSLTDKSNYRSVSLITDDQAEADYGSPAIKEIFSRWIPALGRTVADRLGSILLARFVTPPRHLKVGLLRGSTPEILLGRGYQASSKFLQDVTGAPETLNLQVTRLKPSADIIQIEADEVNITSAAEDLVHRQIVVDTDTANINLRTAHDLIFPAPDASVTVILTVNAGVKASSSSSGLVAVDIGSWPVGVTIVVNILGGIRGAGGNGGQWNSNNAQAGGVALYTRVPINLALSGTLYAGGGGGGGSTYGGQASGSNLPGGGGGGGGVVGGAGGAGGGGSAGDPGTELSGGSSGGPFHFSGAGGGPGTAGASGFSGVIGGVFYQGFAGGAGGAAIDGVSFVTTGTYDPATFVFTPGALGGSILGSQIN